MEVKAEAKYIRMSPRKVRLVAQGLRGLLAKEALLKLQFLAKVAAKPLMKTLKSAIANATNNLKLKEENLKIKRIEIGQGPSFDRFRPVAHGQAHPYKKRTTHIKIILEGQDGTKDSS